MQLVKVLWAKHISSEATWETEEEMRAKYPHLFEVTLLLTRLISFVDDTFKGGGCNSSTLNQVYLSTYSFIYLHIYLFKEAYSSNYVVFIYFCDCIYLFNYIMFVHFSHSCISHKYSNWDKFMLSKTLTNINDMHNTTFWHT